MKDMSIWKDKEKLCRCGHSARQHASVRLKDGKGEVKGAGGCMVMGCRCMRFEEDWERVMLVR